MISGLTGWLTELFLLLVFMLQVGLFSLTEAGQADDVCHPVGGGGLVDRAPQEVVGRSKRERKQTTLKSGFVFL